MMPTSLKPMQEKPWKKIIGAETSIPYERLEGIRRRYEYLRRTEQYRDRGIKEVFQENTAVKSLEAEAKTRISSEDFVQLNFRISFPTDSGRARWQEYGATLLRLYAALAERQAPFPLEIVPNSTGDALTYDITSGIPVAGYGRDATVQKLAGILRNLLYPEGLRYALSPLLVSLTGYRTSISQTRPTFRSEINLRKACCQDFIVLGDLPLVLSYYKQIQEPLTYELSGRGLTVYTAVDAGDGESVIRRNDAEGKRLVVEDAEEIGRLILDYHTYRFVPDVNMHNSDFISKVPIDLDRPSSMEWKAYAEFVTDFTTWLREMGFKPRPRVTGGKGAQIILDLLFDRVATNYSTPFPRLLKFETWIQRVGEEGLISAQAADFVKTISLAYGCYRKNKLRKNAPLTIEMHDLGQRYWNILADSSRAVKGMGVVGVGSIHHKTGAVCMPVTRVPEVFTLDSVLSVAHDSSCVEREEFQTKYRSPWIQVVGAHPSLLEEPHLSSKDNPFSLVEEIFEKYSWIPKKYVEMGSEGFMKRYCWA